MFPITISIAYSEVMRESDTFTKNGIHLPQQTIRKAHRYMVMLHSLSYTSFNRPSVLTHKVLSCPICVDRR